MEATGWSGSEIFTRTLKHTYPDQGEPPAWAKLAYKRHWITFAAYLQIPLEGDSNIADLVYADSPMFKLLKKSWAPYGKAATPAG